MPSTPSLNSLARQRDWKTFTRLPRECSIPVPAWPLEVADPCVAELAMWDRIWREPQAHVWHADHLVDSVALYVRQFIEAAAPRASSNLRVNVRQTAETLLLSVGSMNAARYVIVDSPEDEVLGQIAQQAMTGTGGPTGNPARPGRTRSSARSRMTVVAGTGPGPATDTDDGSDPDA